MILPKSSGLCAYNIVTGTLIANWDMTGTRGKFGGDHISLYVKKYAEGIKMSLYQKRSTVRSHIFFHIGRWSIIKLST